MELQQSVYPVQWEIRVELPDRVATAKFTQEPVHHESVQQATVQIRLHPVVLKMAQPSTNPSAGKQVAKLMQHPPDGTSGMAGSLGYLLTRVSTDFQFKNCPPF